MDERLRSHIGNVYDGGCWECVTGTHWQDGTPWDIWMFERDVEFDGETWRCVIIERYEYSPQDLTAVENVEEIYSAAWII